MGRRKKLKENTGHIVWKVAVYIRLSKEDGNDESNSVVNQRERILAYLKNDFDGEHELVDIYVDDGYTGTDTNRENFQRMLEDIRKHKVTCVIVKDLSRLSRNNTDASYHLENTFVEYDIRFISIELPALDSWKYPEQMNSIAVPMVNVINEDFCRQTSIKVRGTFNSKRRQGQFIGAFAPYGYRKDPDDKHRFVVDDEAADIVKSIFAWYVNEGMSKMGIAKRLNEQGVKNPAAYKREKGLNYCNPNTANNDALWNPKTIADILQNRMYLGHMIQGKYRVKSYKVHTQIRPPEDEWFIVEDTHEPLVDQELFDKAQRLQEKDTRTAPNTRTIHTLSGFVRCPDCGKAMVRSQGGSKTKYSYYQCRTYRDKSKDICTKHSIRAEKLEDAVLQAVRIQVQLVVDLREMVEEVNRSPVVRTQSKRLEATLAGRQKELEKVVSIKDGLYADWKSGDITRDDYRRLKEKYEAQVEQLQEAIASIKREQQMMAEGVTGENPYFVTFNQYKSLQTLTRKIVVDLIDTVYVHQNGEVKIVFAYADQHKLIAEFIESNDRRKDLQVIEGHRAG